VRDFGFLGRRIGSPAGAGRYWGASNLTGMRSWGVGEGAGFVDKALELQCRECGEMMHVERDYGVSGQALECGSCGFYVEEIDLRDSVTERSR
jgi:hypothetical protein